jgi:signal transduction histidine kinase
VVDESRSLADLRRHLEQEVAARTAELTASQAALLRAEKLASLGQFSAGVSHEVANPAAVVSANLRYLEEALQGGAAPPADALECLAESREAVDQIALVTRQLLDASRFAAAPVSPGARVPVAEAVARARAGSGRLLEGHRVEVEVAPGLAAVAQLDVLARVLEQLLDNAARAVRPGRPGAIAIRAAASLGRARIVVEDDGVGMSEETLRRAFDPYFSTRPFGTGRGLGLAVARGLVHSMRGDLRLESAPGRGTRAIVEVPLAEPLAEPLPGPAGPA